MGISLSPRSTSYKIILELKRHGRMDVKELSRILGISPTGVHAHLSNLERDGLVVASTVRGGVGRPRFFYVLTPAGDSLFESRYDEFLVEMLDDLAHLDGPEKVDQLFALRADRLFLQYAPLMEGKDLASRVEELNRLLNESGNMVELELQEDGFALREYHCVICQIARRYPSICRYELEIFQKLLGTPVSRTQWRLEGDPECCHVVNKESSLTQKRPSTE